MGDRPIVAPPSGAASTILAFARAVEAVRIDEVEAFINELYRLGAIVGYDAFRVAVQSALETANWKSVHWRDRLNPGAIGVTDDRDHRLAWANGADAARAMLVHTAAYLGGPLPEALTAHKHLDPRYDLVRQAGLAGSVKDFGDYGNGRWASDPVYGNSLRTREAWMRQYETVDPPPPPPPTNDKAARVVALARQQVGKPYVWGTQGPDTFDCSGLVSWCYRQVGLTLSPDSHEQAKAGEPVERNALRPGDILLYDTMGGQEVRGGNAISHVGLYVGPGEMVNALNPSLGVIVSDPFSSYFAPLYRGARRVITDSPPKPDKPTEIVLPFEIKQWFIPEGQTNQRPGTKQVPKWVVQHETANYKAGAGARMHAKWLHDGAPGAAGTQVSVHFFIDDKECWQTLPIDEVSYNAGCGSCEGNYGGISIELCVNSDSDFEEARRRSAMLSAWLLQEIEKGLDKYSKHQDWSGKWCPALLLNRGLWPSQFEMVKGFLGGVTPSRYVKPDPIEIDGKPWDGHQDVTVNGAVFHAERRRVTGIEQGDVLQYAFFDARPTREPLKADEEFDVLGWVNGEERDRERRWWYTAIGSRVWVGDTVQKPGKDDPTDPDNPNNPDFPPGGVKVLNGRRVYLVGDPGEGREVTISAETAALREYADPAAPALRTLKRGDTFIARYWLIGPQVGEEPLWWVNDDAYVVAVADTAERPV